MPFFGFLKNLRKNLRREQRGQILEDCRCFIALGDGHKEFKVSVSDISKNGISFFIAGTSLNIGETVSIRVVRGKSPSYSLTGQVVGQQVCYLKNSRDVDKAFIRYSVRLAEPLNELQWSELRSP
jgi:hypothetical protein